MILPYILKYFRLETVRASNEHKKDTVYCVSGKAGYNIQTDFKIMIK